MNPKVSETIVLLTNLFPYTEKREAFLETEILYHTRPTLIFALDGAEDAVCHVLPGNCRSYLVGDLPRPTPRNVPVSLSIVWRGTTLAEMGRLALSGKLRFSTLRSLLGFMYRGRQAYRFILGKLKQEGIKKDQRLIFYAYWMHIHAYVALLLQKHFPNSMVVSRCHGYDLYQERAEYGYIPMRKVFAKKVQCFYPISEDGCRYLLERYEIDKKKITLARLGTRNLGIAMPDNRKTLRIISCSNVVLVKRVHLIIDALALVHDIPIKWIHFGSGELLPQHQAHAEAKLRQMTNVQYEWKGFMPNGDYLVYCKDNPFHLFVNVSESEGVPVSIMEALSFGTPVTATAVGGIPEIVEHGENGLLLPKNVAPAKIAGAFRQFYAMPDHEYEIYRKNARESWERKCAADNVYPVFYESLKILNMNSIFLEK